MEQLIALFHRNFPFCVREEAFVRTLLAQEKNVILSETDENGNRIGAAVLEDNTILMLCVDPEYRRRGIGTQLLARAEETIRNGGYASIVIGAGAHYLMPGIPAVRPVVEENLQPDTVYAGLEDHTDFFRKRGYMHRWDCNCFDMRMDLADYAAVPFATEGITYRWARPDDISGITACTDRAHESFTKYYRNPALYREDNPKRVFIAEADRKIVGTLIVSFAAEGDGLGSVGCTAVDPDYQGRKIASNLVILGTGLLRDAGLSKAFLGYTYTGLDKLYGFAGYRICVYYFMAEKKFL